MRLQPGQPAPYFVVSDAYGRTVSLADYAGQHLLVSFYRAAVCPLCNFRLLYFVRHFAEFRYDGLQIVTFFESSPAYVHHYLDRLAVPFPVVADPVRYVYQLYGTETSLLGAVWARLTRWGTYRAAAREGVGGNIWQNVVHMDGHMGRLPAEFLIAPDGRIHTAHYGRDAGDFLPLPAIEAFLGVRRASVVQRGGPIPYTER